MTELEIGGQRIKPGEIKRIELPLPPLYTDTHMSIPVHVQRGKQPGPTMFVSAAIHGDELNGIEIVNRLIKSKSIKNMRGTLIAVPMVNVYGVLNQSRYLPDRRDLNRSFPGSSKGSLAGRIANLFLQEVVTKCDVGIDLHTGAIHRSNLPQIRANLDDAETLTMAEAFGMPVLLNADIRDGSLRQAAADLGAKVLLYEAGEALRFDEFSIRAGVKGIINVMREIGMLNKRKRQGHQIE
ncbi:MAG: putative deacylase, partial [Paraglaciecola sp.]